MIKKIESLYPDLLIINEDFTSKRILINIVSIGNCKVSTWINVNLTIQQILQYKDKDRELLIKTLKNSFRSYANLFLTLGNNRYLDFIKENFNVVYCIKVPLGYGLTPTSNNYYQYHIMIENFKKYPNRTMPKVVQYDNGDKILDSYVLNEVFETVNGIEYKDTKSALKAVKTRLMNKTKG